MFHRETQGIERLVSTAHASIVACYVRKNLRVFAHLHPLLTHSGKSLVYVYFHFGVGIRTGSVVNCDILIGILHTFAIFDLYCGILVYLPHTYAHAGHLTLYINLFRIRI